MTNRELYLMLELPAQVTEQLDDYEQGRTLQLSEGLKNKILNRFTWEEGIQELTALFAHDPDGMGMLWELLELARGYSYKEYERMGIPIEIFTDTMKFITRSLQEHYHTYGKYQFKKAWWFPRQLAITEFRIAALEYEFIDGETREISVHIPSDADFRKEAVLESFRKFSIFRNTYFPEWQETAITCESWLLAPAWKLLLKETSNILAFQDLYELDEIDEDATWFMEWIFPGYDEITKALPERTSLQRNAKQYLLSGNKIGAAKGHLKEEMVKQYILCHE